MSGLYVQKGVGLMEVLVALVILAIGVLGFSALQLKGMEAAQEANEQAIAVNFARDLAERMRVNRSALSQYATFINTIEEGYRGCTSTNSIINGNEQIQIPTCNSENMAKHDVGEIIARAKDLGQTIIVRGCVKSNLSCIYVAWGNTSITSTDVSACINETTGTYRSDAQCLVLEAY